LIPIPQTIRLARRLEQDPGDLAPVDQHVVRPLHERGNHRLALESRRHRKPRDERELGEARIGGGLEQQREEQVRRRRVLPAPARSARPVGLVLGQSDGAVWVVASRSTSWVEPVSTA
jgi:hypothetical protein